MHLELESLRLGYAELVQTIQRTGRVTSPRGEKTVEVVGGSFTLLDPVDSLPVGTNRGVVKALAATETLQLIGGFHDPKTLVKAAPHFANYLGEDGLQRAPYGPRLADQIPIAIEHLKQDRDSRQAQVTIWQPQLDNELGLHDYPCTTSLQWLIRDDKLEAVTHMRSNDLWLGTVYDVFQFTQLQLTIASVLGIEAGPYHHHASSLHLYEKHWEKAETLTEPTAKSLPTYGIAASGWIMAVALARGIHAGQPHSALSSGEQWLYMAMVSFSG